MRPLRSRWLGNPTCSGCGTRRNRPARSVDLARYVMSCVAYQAKNFLLPMLWPNQSRVKWFDLRKGRKLLPLVAHLGLSLVGIVPLNSKWVVKTSFEG